MPLSETVCTRCGKCCISLGRHIRIERSLSSSDHYIRIGITREIVPVRVHPDFTRIFRDTRPETTRQSWCPFLRKQDTGEFVCTIYPSRPKICRDFICSASRILDREGREAGRIQGRRHLKSDNPDLVRFWKEHIEPIQEEDENAWKERMKEELIKAGYSTSP